MKKEVFCHCNSHYDIEHVGVTTIITAKVIPQMVRLFSRYGYDETCNCFFFSMGAVLSRMMKPRKSEDGVVNIIWEI